MPFKSQAQRALCYAMQSRAKKAGKKSNWNCEEWEAETSNKKLPRYKNKSKSKSKTKKRTKTKGKSKSKSKKQ